MLRFDSDTVLLTDNQILINAALRNYDRFLVSVSMVNSAKVKRFYTSAQQTDLDIKTSVNKIGEIVNLSQILNSLYWDNINHGQSHEENFELYCDICTLNTMSGIEIDSAKKEFQVSNTEELKNIRLKYKDVLTEDISGKLIRPKFFAHIVRAKGKQSLYNNKNKAYLKHETPMDYLQEIVRRSSHYRPENKLPPFQPFSVILNRNEYHKDHVYRPSIEKTIEAVNKYLNELSYLHSAPGLSKEDVVNIAKQAEIEMCYSLEKIKYSYSTMYKLLSMLDSDNYKYLSQLLLLTMFKIRHRDIYNALLISEAPISKIVPDANGDIDLFGYKYSKAVHEK